MSESLLRGCASGDHELYPAGAVLLEGPALQIFGSRCGQCGAVEFPSVEVCTQCWEPVLEAAYELPTTGVLYSFTEVHVAPERFETPYVIGYVDLDGVDIRVLAHSDSAFDDLSLGTAVRLEPGVIGRTPTEKRICSYKFRRLED